MGKALGLLEVRGFSVAMAVADAALKAADITVEGWEQTKGGGLVLIRMRGEVDSVQVAVEAGAAEARRISSTVFSHVIARPSDGV